MIANGEWLTPTRASGIAAYGVAATSCGIVWARAKGSRSVRKIAAWLTAIESALLLDMSVNGRWKLHQLFVNIAQNQHEYGQRRLPQMILITFLLAILFASLYLSLRLLRGKPGALLAISGALLSLITWCIEVVSLHQVDAVLYRQVWGGMVVSFVWIAGCLMTSVGILFESRRANATTRCSSSQE
jgi:hypothetical protein